MEHSPLEHIGRWAAIIFLVFVLIIAATGPLSRSIERRYQESLSSVIEDRNGEIIAVHPSTRGYFTRPLNAIPPRLAELLVKKEDRFFYWHLGINPLSILRDVVSYPFNKKLRGSSTLTQQLVKILLGNESQRTLKNKLIESVYALAIELHTPKEKILTMYANSAYFGNQAQGIEEASRFYFRIPADALTDTEALSLLATLNAPSGRFPGTFRNTKMTETLASALGVTVETMDLQEKKTLPKAERRGSAAFELDTLDITCQKKCVSTVDQELTERLREMLRLNLASPTFASVANGAIVVVKLPQNELLAIVGSPDPASRDKEAQFNMAIEPRPIGSTAKPFIYAKAFEKGARPYTLVDDREYKYEIATGFPFYPKNFDGQYRGLVTLHQALSNSLNVPSVKVFEFVGAKTFYAFLSGTLGFKPIQPLEDYGIGIPLGSLEIDLLTLSHYFTVFPNGGILRPLAVFQEGADRYITPPMETAASEEQRVIEKPFTELINKILSDRDTSVDQFGIKSNLNLPEHNYALKTGTSRDFYDSWTIGYTPDFLVSVWLGNSKNVPMQQVTGQTGAGTIWHAAMEMVMNSEYNKKTPFSFDELKEFSDAESMDYGLPGDDYQVLQNIMTESPLILQPHDGDTFMLEGATAIPLKARQNADWFVDGQPIGHGETFSWKPTSPGPHTISARLSGREEKITTMVESER